MLGKFSGVGWNPFGPPHGAVTARGNIFAYSLRHFICGKEINVHDVEHNVHVNISWNVQWSES